jgi:hypothetical protein
MSRWGSTAVGALMVVLFGLALGLGYWVASVTVFK